MKNIRSSLLKPMPGKADAKRLKSMPKRIGLVLLIAVIIGVPIFIIATRFLPRDGSGNIFYWFHDHIYLPVKGYTYTLFYPFSLSWWGPLATLFLVWLIAYLAMVSITKDPHAQVLRRVVRRNSRHGFLLRTTRWLRKWKIEALILKEIVRQEREKALNRLTALPLDRVDDDIFERVFHLTRFHIRLLTLGVGGRVEYLQAALVWYRAYFQFRNRLQRNPGAEQLKRLTVQLAGLAENILPVLLDYRDEVLMKEVGEMPGGFNCSTVVLDLVYLAALHNDNLEGILPGDLGEVSGETIREIVALRVAESTASRRVMLDGAREQVEKIRRGEVDVIGFIGGESKEDWPVLLDDSEEMVIIGRLVLTIALDLAGLVNSSAMGLGVMESIEALDFEMNCLGEEVWEVGLVHPLGGLPQAGDFRWCAELAEGELVEYEKIWKQARHGEEKLVTAGDFQLARNRVRALYHASGPDFDKNVQ
ncbi:MAG: hypothetical protein GY940_17980 [bacterium]|nr:hypothetical protein [bacterium]